MSRVGTITPEKEEISDVDEFLYIAKMGLSLDRRFDADESLFIMNAAEKSRGNRKTVNWDRVMNHFEFECEKDSALKKIKNHYYNKRSSPTRRETKRNDITMKRLGLDI